MHVGKEQVLEPREQDEGNRFQNQAVVYRLLIAIKYLFSLFFFVKVILSF